jgi:shikimate kinase
MRNLFLVGPMGAGKTSIGRQLARSLGLPFFDTDQEIEERTGVDLAWIYDVEGEAGFQLRELEVVSDLSTRKGIVLSTGGGTVIDPECRKLLSARGLVLHLKATVEQQCERLRRDTRRPILRDNNNKEALLRIAEARNALYYELADVSFDTDGKSVSGVVRDIVDYLHSDRRYG